VYLAKFTGHGYYCHRGITYVSPWCVFKKSFAFWIPWITKYLWEQTCCRERVDNKSVAIINNWTKISIAVHGLVPIFFHELLANNKKGEEAIV